MISVGHHITQTNDPLQRVDWDYIVQHITRPSPEFASRISQLRQLKVLDERQYRKQKTSLPYFCCSRFHPSIRRKEFFAEAGSFVLDFDGFSADEVDKGQAFEIIKTDSRVKFLFTSPGGDGLKAVFLLTEPVSDAGLYRHFYKSFVQHFVKQCGLEKFIDYRTYDVTRASFLSADPDAYYNPNADLIDISDFVALDSIDDEVERNFEALRKEFGSQLSEESKKTGVSDEILILIKQKLNPSYRPKHKEKDFFVPEEIKKIMPFIQESLQSSGILVREVRSIQYGKQLHIEMGNLWAELNLFHGKRGFTVVKTTKSGSNQDLAALGYQLINQLLDQTV